MCALPIDSTALHRRYRDGASVSAVVDQVLARLEAVRDPGIFTHVLSPDVIRRSAQALPPFDPVRYPLWGLPFAIKDNIDLTGVPTTAGCPSYAYVPSESATAVERLTAAGAVPVGKTNLDQFATGLVGVRTPYPVPRNAFDPKRVPGGSSSGSAVAVATGIVTFALGTDTAGSGRIPAALNNVVGLKPTVGLVPTRGVVPACRTLDCISIFALEVANATAVLDCISGYDERDPFSRHLAEDRSPIRRVAVPRSEDLQFFGDKSAAMAWHAAIEKLSCLDIAMSTLDMAPFLDAARLLYEGPWVAERYAAVQGFIDERPDEVHPVTRKILASATRHSAVDAFNAMYRLAALKRECERAMAPHDAIVVPTAPIFPTLAELVIDPIEPNSRLGTYTNFVNLLDLAAIAVPGPFRSDGLPAGITLIGRAGSDRALASLAGRFFAGRGGTTASGATDTPPRNIASKAT